MGYMPHFLRIYIRTYSGSPNNALLPSKVTFMVLDFLLDFCSAYCLLFLNEMTSFKNYQGKTKFLQEMKLDYYIQHMSVHWESQLMIDFSFFL